MTTNLTRIQFCASFGAWAVLVWAASQLCSDASERDKTVVHGTAAAESEREWHFNLADLEKLVDRSAEGNLMLTVGLLANSACDWEVQRVLNGQSVETIGKIAVEEGLDPSENRLRVYVMERICCELHLRMVSIAVEFAGDPPGFENDSWVKVVGIIQYPTEKGKKRAILKVKRIEPTEAIAAG